MSKPLLSESDVLKKIGAKDFRSISKKQFLSFVSSIPDMDKEVAIRCIEQFPNFKEMGTEMINVLQKTCDTIIKESGNKIDQSIDAYRSILTVIETRLECEELTYEQKQEVTQEMIDVADKIEMARRDHQAFLERIIGIIGSVVGGIVMMGAGLLGLKFIKRN